MKKLLLLFFAFVVLPALPGRAQTAAAKEFDIKKVTIEMIDSPTYSVSGPPAKAFRPGKWVEIEVTFDAKPDFTDELVFNYYVYINKRLFTGTVNHVNIEKGMGLNSVMYISPKMVNRIMGSTPGQPPKPLTAGEVIATVQITKPGVQMPLAERSSKAGTQPNWWAAMKQEPGFLSSKNETPFAPLWWDRYEAVKLPTSR